jgi:hypothetical protein
MARFPPKGTLLEGDLMRSSFGRSDSVGWGARIAIGIAVLILLGLVGLVTTGGTVKPPHQQTYEQVLPDAQFPH